MLNYKRILGLIYREVVNFVVESFFLRQPGETMAIVRKSAFRYNSHGKGDQFAEVCHLEL